MKNERESQVKKILAWMQNGKSITAIEALNMFGCFRLSARINNIKDMGLSVQKDMVETDNGKRIARYYL